MLKGFVERRVAQRAPLKTEVKIRFEDSERVLVAHATDISAGGIQFAVPWGTEMFEIGQMINLVFSLPVLGEIQVQAEIRHNFFGIDNDQNRLIFYGCRFVDISMETWNYIMDYCQVKLEMLEAAPKVKMERKDLRVAAPNLMTQIQLDEGAPFFGMIEDISFGGVKLKTSLALPVNSSVLIKILTKEPLALEGTCVWSGPNPKQKDEHYAGIFFNRLDPERFNQLRALIFDLARNQGPTTEPTNSD